MLGFHEFFLILLLLEIPSIIALVDILRHQFTGNNKLIWTLVVLFTSIIGALLYFYIGRKQKLTNHS
jgi:uncharacterized membrane protein YdjX (TVP38/TMEM64 family)